MLTVACVLRSGGVYDPRWVWALKRNLKQFLPPEHSFEFVVLSDLDCFAAHGVRLKHSWPTWWAKMELFRPDVFKTGPVLYLDLDTIVTGSFLHYAQYQGTIAMVSDFYRPQFGQSGVMLWHPGPVVWDVWDRFMAQPMEEMRRLRDDGQCIYRLLMENKTPPERLQDLYPGEVVSYKVHASGGVPVGARLVCLHGTPKQHDPSAGWAHNVWKQLTVGQPQEV